jgi:hypothetical protein
MRKLTTNAQDTFRVKAYAGTNGVLLAFDLDESLKNGLLGFAIRQKEGTKPWQWLLNSLTFPGKTHTLPKWNATPSNLAPVQKFRWADYSIDPGTTCRYRVSPVYGTPDEPVPKDALEVEVTADDGKPRDHRMLFNRAVAASQSFGRKFPQLDQLLDTNKNLSIEDWPDAPRKWLENGLLDRNLGFIARATDEKWAIDLAIYEYELKAIVDAINAAHKRKVAVRIIYHGKPNDDQTAKNEDSLRKIPASKKRARVTSKIFHDKFIVLSKINAAGKRLPQAVMCGSTKISSTPLTRICCSRPRSPFQTISSTRCSAGITTTFCASAFRTPPVVSPVFTRIGALSLQPRRCYPMGWRAG